MADVKITVRPNGPYRVEGVVTLVDAEGKEWDLTGKPAFSLCRCGASVNKPFCDGTHSKIGFQAAEAAVRAEQNPTPPGRSELSGEDLEGTEKAVSKKAISRRPLAKSASSCSLR
jgi:CDGSH-type Zn-finger protein